MEEMLKKLMQAFPNSRCTVSAYYSTNEKPWYLIAVYDGEALLGVEQSRSLMDCLDKVYRRFAHLTDADNFFRYHNGIRV
jgi:hypothetical protein